MNRKAPSLIDSACGTLRRFGKAAVDRRARGAVLFGSAVALAACGGGGGDRNDAGLDGGRPTLDSGPMSGDAGERVDAPRIDGGETCGFVDSLDRSCRADEDCAAEVHQTDCCGNTVAIGVNVGERDRFAAAETACRASLGSCLCPSGPTETDSGEDTFEPSQIHAACVSQGPELRCLTYVSMRPPDLP